MNVQEIFLNGIFENKKTIIKTVNVDEKSHKIGLFNILKSIINDYQIDSTNKETINILFNYFTGNKLFCIENNIDLNKGILLCGGVGTGKSVIFEAFKKYCCEINQVNGFQFYTSISIIDNVNISGVNYLEKFNYQDKQTIACYIDDIASKNEKVKNYGTEISVIEQLISIRYNVYSRAKKLTHFSTNIIPSKLNEYYDERIIDRLKEMCNIVSLPGISRRK